MQTSNLNDHQLDSFSYGSTIRSSLWKLLLVSCITPAYSPSSSPTSSNEPESERRIENMMPLAPTMTEIPAAHRPKIGFSIDSIVGDAKNDGKDNRRSHLKRPSSPSSSPSSPEKKKTASSDLNKESSLSFVQKQHQNFLKNENKERMSPPMPMLLPNQHPHPFHQLRLPLLHQQHLSPPPPHGSNSSPANYSPGRTSPSTNSSSNDIITTTTTTSANSASKAEQISYSRHLNDSSTTSSPSQSPQPSDSPKRTSSDIPSSPHEIHRPLVSTASLARSGMSGSPGMPPVAAQQQPHLLGPHGIPPPFAAAYPPGMLNFAAMAAAAAAQQGHHPVPHHPAIPGGWIPAGHPVAPHHHPHPAASAHPLYPWLLAKHSRLFPPRFGPGPDLPGFLFQPFRKPKRIRTAFSPSQLLKLEHAFEKNHYVVGAERKQLAKSLSLSETQVKIWYQNRRTKHKRLEQEEVGIMKNSDGSARGNGSSGSSGPGLSTSADSSTRNYLEGMSEDEEIVMDEEYSDDEEMAQNSHLHHPHHPHHHIHKSYS